MPEGLDGVRLDLLGVLSVEFADTEIAHLFEDVLEMELVHVGLATHESRDLVEGLRFAEFHLQSDITHLCGGDRFEADGVIVMSLGLTADMGDHVGPVQNALIRMVGTISSHTAAEHLGSVVLSLFLFLRNVRHNFPPKT